MPTIVCFTFYRTCKFKQENNWIIYIYIYIILTSKESITTKVVSSNSVHGKVYSIKHFVIKFISDLRQVSGFVWVLHFPLPIKLTATIYLKYC